MATTTSDLATHQRRIFSLPFARLAAIALALLLAWNGAHFVDEYYRLFALPFQPHVRDLGGSDFPAFYGGAELFLEDPSNAYDGDAQGRAIAVAKSRAPDSISEWERYYNPPFYSLLLAPLTLFDLHLAYAISFLVNAAGMGLLLGVLYGILLKRRLVFAFLAVGLIVSQPVNYAFWHAQPTLFLTAFLGFVYLKREEGQPIGSGLAWAALLVKPHWLAVPLLGLRTLERRQIVVAGLALTALALPFFLVGPTGTLEYVNLLVGRGQTDVTDQSFAEAVLSWPGFFRGLTGQAHVTEGLLMSGLTVLYYVAIRLKGNDEVLPLAGAAAFVLIVPHSHPQDWIMLAPGAAILMRSQVRPLELGVTAALLTGLSLGLDNWSALIDRRDVIYWPTLAGFSLLVWLYIVASLPEATNRSGGRPAISNAEPINSPGLAEPAL